MVFSVARRRASVAVVLRPRANGELYNILLIQRSARPGDKWSGHVALPGGIANPGENLRRAAIRECREEVGMDLTSADFEYVGRLDDRFATDALVVSAFVFLERSSTQGDLTLEPSEVSRAWWLHLEELGYAEAAVDHVSALPYLPGPLRASPQLAKAFGMAVFATPSIPIRTKPVASVLPAGPAPPAKLWGLTLRIVHDLRSRLAGVRENSLGTRLWPPWGWFVPIVHPANALVILGHALALWRHATARLFGGREREDYHAP